MIPVCKSFGEYLFSVNLRRNDPANRPLRCCFCSGVGIIPWSPLSRGFLTRPIGEVTKRTESDPGFKGRSYDAPPESLVAVNKA